MKMKKKYKLVKILILYSVISLGAYALAACKTYSYNPGYGPDGFPYHLMLALDDLPPGWERDGGSFPDVPEEAAAYLVAYTPDEENIGHSISHRIVIYPDEQSAITAYPEWEVKWFNEHWRHPDETTFIPSDQNDDFRIGFITVSIDGEPIRSYTYLQRHYNMIILVLANLDGENITFEQFEEMLQSLDDRLQDSDWVP